MWGGSENYMYSPTFSRFNEKINGAYWNTSMVVIKCYKHLNFNPPENKCRNQWILGFAQDFQTIPMSGSISDAQPLASRTGQPWMLSATPGLFQTIYGTGWSIGIPILDYCNPQDTKDRKKISHKIINHQGFWTLLM